MSHIGLTDVLRTWDQFLISCERERPFPHSWIPFIQNICMPISLHKVSLTILPLICRSHQHAKGRHFLLLLLCRRGRASSLLLLYYKEEALHPRCTHYLSQSQQVLSNIHASTSKFSSLVDGSSKSLSKTLISCHPEVFNVTEHH